MTAAEMAIPISRLVKMIPGNPTTETVRRWIVDGRTSRSGRIVKMKDVKITSGRGSTMQYYQDFIQELQT